MNSLEAITRLVSVADAELKRQQASWVEQTGEMAEVMPDEQELAVSIAVITAMLNTALPIARFRAFVEVDPIQPKTDKQRPVTKEFTVCAVTVDGIRSGIHGLTVAPTNVRVLIFEQQPSGAEMVSAYQGKTKCLAYREWLKSLEVLNTSATVQ